MRIVRFALLLFFLPILLWSCMPQDKMTVALDTASTSISKELVRIDSLLADAAEKLSAAGLSGKEAKDVLEGVCSPLPFSVDCITIDTQGVIVDVHPDTFESISGTNIGDQPQVRTMMMNHKPVMGDMFLSVEGIEAVDTAFPIFGAEGDFIGSVSLLFRPDLLLRAIIEKTVAGTEVNIWVVDTNGLLLYDIMDDHIGLNLFTAPLYQPFPSLHKIGRRIVNELEGKGTYSFFKPQTNETVTKEAIWKTVSLYGKEWRIVAYRVTGQ